MRRPTNQAADVETSSRRPFALQLSAIAEIVICLAAVLTFGVLLEIPDRFASIAPHPFWIIVILAATRHGTGVGLTAAALASVALLAGNIPEQAFDETMADWLLRTTKLPVIWFLTAIVLGEIRSGHVRAHEELTERFHSLHARADRIAVAYEALAQAKSRLEQRISGQKQTLRSTYEASRSIERDSVEGVLDGAMPFVRSLIDPRKASLFILADDKLTALARHNWAEADKFAIGFDASSTLFEAVVGRRDHLSVTDDAGQAALEDQGLMAGPLVDGDSGRVFGMLKIEDTDLSGLSASSAIEFRVVCDWIGRACGNAWRASDHAQAGIGRQDGAASRAAIFGPVLNDDLPEGLLNAGVLSSVSEALARHRARRREERIASAERLRAGQALNGARLLREEATERDRVSN